MKQNRGNFLVSVSATLLVLFEPRAARAARAAPPAQADSAVARAVSQVPGTAAVYARSIAAAAPLVSINATTQFPAASIIKLWIMVIVFRAIDAGELTPSLQVPIAEHDIVGGSETFGSASPGQMASLARLVKAMIQQSDNTAANALTRYLGFERINREIERAGFRATRMQRYFMYFPSVHDNLTSAGDVGELLVRIARGARDETGGSARGEAGGIASNASCRAMVRTLLGQEDREKIAPGLPAGTPLANKTGELPGVRHDAGIVDPFGASPYVLVVLEKNLSDQRRGVRAINDISKIVFGLLGP
jgi:beta-lactamase class A